MLVFTWHHFSYMHKNDALEEQLWPEDVCMKEQILSLKCELWLHPPQLNISLQDTVWASLPLITLWSC